MPGTRPSSWLIRLLCGQVSPTAIIELNYWPSLRHWLHALPVASCEQDSTTRQFGLQSGVSLCEPHICLWGTLVNAKGSHGLFCKCSAGRSIRHHQLNDLIWRALTRASIPSVKEPAGLSRSDGKHPRRSQPYPLAGKKSASHGT